MSNKQQPRIVPVDLKTGNNFKTPFGEISIEKKRGNYTQKDTREWYIKDVKTGEELWVDWSFFAEMMKSNINKYE